MLKGVRNKVRVRFGQRAWEFRRIEFLVNVNDPANVASFLHSYPQWNVDRSLDIVWDLSSHILAPGKRRLLDHVFKVHLFFHFCPLGLLWLAMEILELLQKTQARFLGRSTPD
jgi:hypothetical protein